MIRIQDINNILNGGVNSNVIYNKYQRSDFSTGADNLNPVRELDIYAADGADGSDLDGVRVLLYEAYSDRLKELQAMGLDPSRRGDVSDITGALNAADLGLPYGDRTQISSPVTMNEATDATDVAPSMEEDVMQLMGALEALLGSEALSTDDLPFDLCGDRGSSPFGDPSSGASGGGSSGSSSSSSTGATGSSGSTGVSSSGATENGLIANNTEQQSAASCLQLELELLAIILAILNIIRMIQAIERYVMATIMPIINIATMIAAVWLNPSLIGKIIQQLAGMGIAFVIDIITAAVMNLLKSLNLDCLLTSSMNSLQSIMGTVGGVKGAYSEAKSFVDFTNPDNPGFIGYNLNKGIQTAKAMNEASEGRTSQQFFSELSGSTIDGVGAAVTDAYEGSALQGIAEKAAEANEMSNSATSQQDVVKDHFADGYETY